MADMVTKQELEAAKVDVKNAGEAVNEEKVVKTRLGRSFKSIPLIVKEGEAKITQAAQTITSATASIVSQKNQASEVISQAESDVMTAATDVHQRGNQEIINLQNAIDIAAAAGAGENGWTAQLIVDSSGVTQQAINDLTGAPYWAKAGGYNIGERAILGSGDIVKSTVAGNTVDPNVDMTGWEPDAPPVMTQYQYTLMGKAFSSTDGVDDNAAMWPHANITYDVTTDNFIILYNTNSGHDIVRNSVLFRTVKAGTDAFSNPIVVASDKLNYSYKCQGSGIAANGDYVAIIAQFTWAGPQTPVAIWAYRSTDKGVTWTRTQMLDASNGNEAILAYNGDASGFLLTQSGRILTFANHPTTVEARIYYSDDNGTTWHKSTIAGNPKEVTEPAWCDLGGGKLICYARAAVRYGNYDQIIPAKVMKSTDNGLSWSAPVDSVSIPNMTLGNGELLPDYENKTVEFVYHSRYTDADNFCSLYRSCATFDDAFNDQMQKPERIGKMVAYTEYLTSTGDSGYVGAAKDKNGSIFGMFYTGQRKGTIGLSQLSYFVAGKSKKQDSDFLLDYRSGEKVYQSDLPSNTTADAYQSIDVFNNGVEKLKPLSLGFTNEDGDGTGTWTKSDNTWDASLFGEARKHNFRSIKLDRSIDTSVIDEIEVEISELTKTGIADLTISLYTRTMSDTTLGSAASTRLAVFSMPSDGTYKFDLRQYKGRYVDLHIVANVSPTNTVASTLTAKVKRVALKSTMEKKEFSSRLLPHESGLFSTDFGLAALSGVSSVVKVDGTGTASYSKVGGVLCITSTKDTQDLSATVIFENPIPSNATGAVATVRSSNDNGDFGLAVYKSTSPANISARVKIANTSSPGRVIISFAGISKASVNYLGIVSNNSDVTEKNTYFCDIAYTFD
ncbi:sialidase family protein [Acinetobacter indicus]|uniref:sialidase family protein n=1 Tax=Acinetobacter indicus TaxID=756892 RepID=UPI0014444B6D|nr:sialidase family protein [Acinetobacter indicus]